MIDWAEAFAPDMAEFERLAESAMTRLPAAFRAHCEGVIVQIDDFPDDETLREMDCESPYDLLGLFRGIGLAQDEAMAGAGRLPNMIHLYRRPIIDYWAEHEESLGAIISHVLIHEIGHHMGLSDEDMEAIEASAA